MVDARRGFSISLCGAAAETARSPARRGVGAQTGSTPAVGVPRQRLVLGLALGPAPFCRFADGCPGDFFRDVLRFDVPFQLIVSLARLAGGALLFACAKSKQSGLKGKAPDTPRAKHARRAAPLWNPRSGRNHRGVGGFLSLDTLEQRASLAQPPKGKGGGTPRLKMRAVCSGDERFLPG